jgi:hypothetical protein
LLQLVERLGHSITIQEASDLSVGLEVLQLLTALTLQQVVQVVAL